MPINQRRAKRRLHCGEWTLTAAKAQFSDVVQRALDGEPQRIVRNGREAVVLLAAADYEATLRPKTSLVELFSALRGSGIEIDRPKGDRREAPEF